MPRRPPVAERKRDNLFHMPGSYVAALKASCQREVTDPVEWLTASGDADTFAEFEREVAVLADLAFDDRYGEPVEAWWYWLPRPLPLRRLGKSADGPRRFLVTPDDMVEPVTA